MVEDGEEEREPLRKRLGVFYILFTSSVLKRFNF
jgi:hypothetical protein